jgi:hypothetical protein
VISHNKHAVKPPYFIADKTLIVEVVKELLPRTNERFRAVVGISLNNLNTEQKKYVVVQLKFDFKDYVHVQQGLKFTNYYLFVVINLNLVFKSIYHE